MEHCHYVMKRYRKEIAESIRNTKIYGPKKILRELNDNYRRSEIVFYDTDSVSCLYKLGNKEKKIAILNFADYVKPGGLYLEGATTQEESLCRESTLYPVLLAFKKSYYEVNKKHLNGNLYYNRALYSPKIIFEREDRLIKADVITCAAPNESFNDEVLEDRIGFIFDIAREQNVDTLIAGAWGCGAFGQDPYKVAEFMWVNAYGLREVAFAIPEGYNNDVFREVFGVL